MNEGLHLELRSIPRIIKKNYSGLNGLIYLLPSILIANLNELDNEYR